MKAFLSFCLGAAAFVGPAYATVGMAEWEVYTPGGNLISHSDLWKDEHGTCLRSEAVSIGEEAAIHASHLERWRYYEGYVAGQDANGFFLFHESKHTTIRFESESALSERVDSLGLNPISTWLGPGDGWQEAWFPFMTWRPCKILLGESLETAAAGLSLEQIDELRRHASQLFTTSQCREALQRARFELYRRTTWGRECDQLAEALDPMPAEQRFFHGFCDELQH